MNESVVIKQIQDGNINAFDELFNRYKNTALRTAYLITGNLHTGEDVVQETFIQCYLKINSLKNPDSFKSWFYRILTRTAWNYSKKDKKLTPVEDIYERADGQGINQSMADYLKSQEYEFIYSEIDKLDIKLKTTIILFYFNDLSVKETAKALGCLEGTVKSRLHNARAVLKKKLSCFYDDNSEKKGVRENETIKA